MTTEWSNEHLYVSITVGMLFLTLLNFSVPMELSIAMELFEIIMTPSLES